ncbi:NAD(P)-binding domain-containing protein [Paenarthrobacter sp. PH39-S1]|uniref:NAD(P)-dependent oxidoreductase n=1 Tax=Paenarthrobacter sp. PH39-S1 TaxID=3046204 RepID=UPI0024BAD49D|nr:NAD(P)-binding domain-containing protein [Paenarthrobacter sp. PH39-S1]MDJ0355543.1 NAD(P)-binding domain-containing protein [Paenarthrobacter sp. PH39-S1]
MSRAIAFIGLGHMGAPMAADLVRAGYLVTGFDVVPAAVDAAPNDGLTIAESGAEAVTGAEVIITMLQAGQHALAAYQGSDGLLAAAAPGSLFLECSTIAVADARVAHDMVLAAGHGGLDAPVSGGVAGAEAGSLTFMVGGDAGDFADAAEIFDVMGKRIVHFAGAGAGTDFSGIINDIRAAAQTAGWNTGHGTAQNPAQNRTQA